MADWGSTTLGTGSQSQNQYYFMGGVSDDVSGMTLDSITVGLVDGSTVRLALYSGGAIDDITANGGLTLIEDLGEITNSTGGNAFVTLNSTTNPSIPQNSRIWIGVKDDAFFQPSANQVAGDIDSAVRWFGPNRSSAVAWEANITSQNAVLTAPFIATYITYSAGAAFAIDTIPTTINADGSFDVVVSNPATVPTTLNSTIKLTNASGQAATINSVTGSDPYTISATFPRASTDAFFGDYALYVVVDAENATSGGTASYEPASGWSYVDVGTIDTSSEIYTQYSAGTIATGWQAVIKSPTNEDSVTVTMTDDLNYTFGPYVGSTDQTTEFYAINASQTVLAEETITFDFSTVGVPVLSSPTGTATGAATASGTVTTDDGTGTLYFYASTNSTETAATIKASGSSQAVGVSGSQGVGVTGLTPETLYYLHYVQDDDGAQESNVVSSSSFTTLATSDVPAASRTSIFQIANYLRSLGTYNSSQCNELVVEWLVSEGITRTQINQMLYGYLGGLGYTGSFNDRLKAWSEDV